MEIQASWSWSEWGSGSRKGFQAENGAGCMRLTLDMAHPLSGWWQSIEYHHSPNEDKPAFFKQTRKDISLQEVWFLIPTTLRDRLAELQAEVYHRANGYIEGQIEHFRSSILLGVDVPSKVYERIETEAVTLRQIRKDSDRLHDLMSIGQTVS